MHPPHRRERLPLGDNQNLLELGPPGCNRARDCVHLRVNVVTPEPMLNIAAGEIVIALPASVEV